MRPFLLAGTSLLALFGLACTSSGARAAAVLDQQYLVNNGSGTFSGAGLPGFRRVETFTVGVAGTLSEVDIFTSSSATFTGFNILSTTGGTPTTTVLATGVLASQSGGVAAFSVSFPVSVGEVLAIEPVASGGGYGWLNNTPGTYAGGGDFFVNPNFGVNSFTATGEAEDFRTFVTVATVAEPASLALLGTGLFGVGLLGRRQARQR